MKKKKQTTDQQPQVKVGNVSGVGGSVNIASRDVITYETRPGLNAVEIENLFNRLYAIIDSRADTPEATREDLKSDVKEIQSNINQAAQKNEKIDEGSLAHRFRNIARMAPDILEVIVTTLANPLAGLGVAVRKIAEKAKEEIKQD